MYSLRLYYNLLFLLILISEIKTIDVVTGEVSIQNLIYSKSIELNFNSDNNLLIHILSIDCEIKVASKNNKKERKSLKINEISNYNYNAFYISAKLISAKLIISPLINSLNEQKQKKNYRLIINSISSNNPELNMTKNEPIFLYFNKELQNVTLLYKFENSDLKYPIIISFFIKEKIKFRIKISDENNNIIINKNINYKENIIIKPESDKTYNICINPEEVNLITDPTTMIVKIIQNNNTPFYLQKNQLNLGFIPIEIDYYYYYMEIFEGEEGEIMLFNKRQNGILISKIIGKKKYLEVRDFPKYNENDSLSNDYLEFNIYNQKLSFSSSKTEKCEDGCFLLITYYSNIKSLEINGTEFSILSRIWDEEEFESQINSIPLNEYIFGFFDEDTVNIHYYSVFIPYESNNIYIEIHGNNINGFSKEGIVKINTYKLTNNSKIIFEEEYQKNKIVTLKKEDIGLKLFKGKYISFAFEQSFSDYSYYYFRIFQSNPENDYIIYPLDTNKENYCETKDNKCYFLLKNDYNDLSNKIFIYGFGEINTFYNVSSINYNDYPKNLNSDYLREIKEIGSYKDYLSFDLKSNDSFVLIIIETNSTENKYLSLFSSLYNETYSPFINIYSYQLYHLSEKTFQQYYLYKNPLIKYRILINTTEGEGNICFDQICDKNKNSIHLTEQKIYSFSISKETNFLLCAKNDLIFNIKIIYEFSNEAIKELNYLFNSIEINNNEEIFPLIYIIKDVKYNGININFNFNFNNSNNINNAYNNLVIKGYGLDYSEILSIKEKDDIKMIDFPYNEIKGKYDNITNSGYIELSSQLISTKYNETYKYTEDIYYFIIIENITSFDFKNLTNDIYIVSKDEINILLPINKYIRNSFSLLGNQTIIQKYYFEKENITNNQFILEFSSNYKNIELTFNNLTNCDNTEIIGGFNKYVLSINSNNSNDYYFNLSIKPINKLNLKNDLKEVNIIIKYYNKRQKISTDYICNKEFKLERINIREKNSDYKLIINNKNEIINFQNDLNYIYYLRLIKITNILNNEKLNTIATVLSNLFYINKFNTFNSNDKILFNLNKLENNEDYIASLFIKVQNKNEGEEIYYSIIYEFNTEIKNHWMIIALIIIPIFIISLLLFYIIWRKMKIKNRSLENKVNAISFSTGINQDLINNRDSGNSNKTEDYENTFI